MVFAGSCHALDRRTARRFCTIACLYLAGAFQGTGAWDLRKRETFSPQVDVVFGDGGATAVDFDLVLGELLLEGQRSNAPEGQKFSRFETLTRSAYDGAGRFLKKVLAEFREGNRLAVEDVQKLFEGKFL